MVFDGIPFYRAFLFRVSHEGDERCAIRLNYLIGTRSFERWSRNADFGPASRAWQWKRASGNAIRIVVPSVTPVGDSGGR